jgi:hypothetical protein
MIVMAIIIQILHRDVHNAEHFILYEIKFEVSDMIIVGDLSGQNTPVIKKFLVYSGAADIEMGALVEHVANAKETAGCVNKATLTDPALTVGLLTQLHDYSEVGQYVYNGTFSTKTNRPEGDVDVRPFAIFRAEMSAASAETVAISAAGATVTLGTGTGTDDEMIGSWLYNATTDELRYVEDSASATSLTINTVIGATAWTSTGHYIIPHIFYGGASNTGLTLNTACTKIDNILNGTGAWSKVIGTYVSVNGGELQRLNPGIHEQTLANAIFFSDIIILDHAFNVA